jgi:hypothetical protein
MDPLDVALVLGGWKPPEDTGPVEEIPDYGSMAAFAGEAEVYREEMEMLHRGGADYSGNEAWRLIMRRVGRCQ